MISASLFLDLPPELICQIFESVDDFSIVAALAQTARIFYYTWRENPTSICRAVAPRVFSNLLDAERLLDIQEEAESQSQDDRKQKPIIRAKRFLSNARCASAAINDWVNLCLIDEYWERVNRDPHVTPSEIARFEHAFYCLWTIGVMEMTPHLQDRISAFVDRCSLQELCGLIQVRDWAEMYTDNNFKSSDLDVKDEVWKAGFDVVSDDSLYRLRAFPPCPEGSPLGLYAFFDNTQKYLHLMEDE